jgi:hypothetical protein
METRDWRLPTSPARVYLPSSACSVSGKPDFVETAIEPVGPPQRWLLVATLLRRLSTAFVDEYPIVIATTNKAPGNTAGLPTGMSKYRQPTPTAKLTKRPMTNLIRLHLYPILRSQRRSNWSHSFFILWPGHNSTFQVAGKTTMSFH